MINRYTLQFKDQSLEEKYQEFQLEHKRKPLAKSIIISTFIIVIIQCSFAIPEDNRSELYKSIGYLVGNLCFLSIYMKKPKYIRWAFILITQLFVLSYIKVEEGRNQFHYQQASVLILALQLVIIITGEFLDAVVQIVPIFLVYFSYYIKYEKNKQYTIIASVFMIGFLLLNSLYKNAEAGRSKFLLTLLENQWDQILLNNITQPSIIFSFDLIQNNFQLKKSFHFPYNCNTTDELKSFLRLAKLAENDSTSLEKYMHTKLHQLQKISDHIINQELLVKFNKYTFEIKFSIFPGASPIIIVQLLYSKQIKETHKIEKLYQYKYLTLLKSMQVQLKNIYKGKKKSFKQILKLFLYRDLQERSKRLFLMKKFNLKTILMKLKNLYKNKQIQVLGDFEVDIISQKYLIILILIEAIESSISQNIQITISQEIQKNIFQFNVESQFTENTLENFKLHYLNFQKQLIQIQVEKENISFQIVNKIQDHVGLGYSLKASI